MLRDADSHGCATACLVSLENPNNCARGLVVCDLDVSGPLRISDVTGSGWLDSCGGMVPISFSRCRLLLPLRPLRIGGLNDHCGRSVNTSRLPVTHCAQYVRHHLSGMPTSSSECMSAERCPFCRVIEACSSQRQKEGGRTVRGMNPSLIVR